METVRATLDNANMKYVIAGAVTVASAYAAWRKFLARNKVIPHFDVPAGTVLLHQIPRGPFAPSLSPFPIKLEMFLRLAKIPYQNDFSMPFSTKGKTPWMTYEGHHVADSQLCIQYLKEKLGVDIDQGLSAEQRAVARAIQVMCDEHLFWTMVYFRFIHDNEQHVLKIEKPVIPTAMLGALKRRFKGQMEGQGLGRHTTEELVDFMKDDLTSLQNFLGDKKFMMGDHVTEVDCAVFGQVAQFVYHQQDAVCKDLVQGKFPKLHSYIERVKAAVWPDWEQVITHGSLYKK